MNKLMVSDNLGGTYHCVVEGDMRTVFKERNIQDGGLRYYIETSDGTIVARGFTPRSREELDQ